MMKLLLALILMFSFAHAQAPQCRSQLLRISVANNAISGVTGRSALNLLKGLAPNLQELLKRSYEIQPIPFPVKQEECDRLGVNCPRNFCEDPASDPEIKKQVCFALPCTIFEGSKGQGKCSGMDYIFGKTISFPEPVTIQRLAWEVRSIDMIGKDARLCFRINDLALSLGTQFDFDVSNTRLTDHAVVLTNIAGELDEPKDVCVSAQIDIASHRPVKNVKIIPVASGPFISEQVIRTAARNVRISGLTGYSQRELQTVLPELLPVLVHPLRQSIEESVAQALGTVLEDQVAEYVNQMGSETPLVLDSSAFMSELSYTSKSLWEAAAFYECRHLVFSGKPVPENHACLGMEVTFFDRPGHEKISHENISTSSDVSFFLEASTLGVDLSYYRWGNTVAESFRKKLVSLQMILESHELSPDLTPEQGKKVLRERQSLLKNSITPFIANIDRLRLSNTLLNNVEIQGDLVSSVHRDLSLAIPGICNKTAASPHANVSIPNCPIQAYVDLNEFNRVLTTLWDTGRMCNGGAGVDCALPTDLIYCKLGNAPQLRYLGRSGRFASSIKLRNCNKDILPFGIFGASLGADFNVEFTFKPKACYNGDFCIDQPNVTWSIVSGTEQGWLKDPFLRGKITDSINKSIHDSMSKTFRIPFASATSGFMADIPLRAEGRTKAGAGYFGVCLKEER